jgi:hypothetical protein
MRIPLVGLLVAGLSLSACAYDSYSGYGGGYGYNSYYPGYGYSSYYPRYYRSSYYPSYYGWYADRYYPGVGIHVYDHYRRPSVWTDSQRRYWSTQRDRVVRSSTAVSQRRTIRENWSGFHRGRAVRMEQASNRDRRRSNEQ